MGPTIYHVETLGAGFLAVMAKPVAGEWIDEEFEGIARFGVKKVVSLLEPSEAIEVGLAQESSLCKKFAMEFVSYPIEDRGLPMSVGSFAQFTKSLYTDILRGLNTVVHCRAGIGRTGLTAGAILLHYGLEPEEAFASISKARGVQVPDTDGQITWFNEFFHAITQGA